MGKRARVVLWLMVTVSVFILSACGPERERNGEPDRSTVAEQRVVSKHDQLNDSLLPTVTPAPEKVNIAAATTPSASERWVVVTATVLNVRSGPALDTELIATVNGGECLPVKGEESDWLLLELESGAQGWSSVEFLNEVAVCSTSASVVDVAEPAVQPKSEYGLVNAALLNVRGGPGIEYPVLGQLEANDCVEVVAAENDWLQVRLEPTLQGWCSQEFITLVDACADLDVQVATDIPSAEEQVVQSASYVGQPFAPNAVVVQETYIHECFGSGSSELRWVPVNTHVQVLGTGSFAAPDSQQRQLGGGPFLKIRIWDGQYAWIPASTVAVDIETVATVSGQCEAYDRIDWTTVVRSEPTPTVIPITTGNPSPVVGTGSGSSGSSTSRSCCKICTKGKACGNSCISRSYTCHKGPGCACNG